MELPRLNLKAVMTGEDANISRAIKMTLSDMNHNYVVLRGNAQLDHGAQGPDEVRIYQSPDRLDLSQAFVSEPQTVNDPQGPAFQGGIVSASAAIGDLKAQAQGANPIVRSVSWEPPVPTIPLVGDDGKLATDNQGHIQLIPSNAPTTTGGAIEASMVDGQASAIVGSWVDHPGQANVNEIRHYISFGAPDGQFKDTGLGVMPVGGDIQIDPSQPKGTLLHVDNT